MDTYLHIPGRRLLCNPEVWAIMRVILSHHVMARKVNRLPGCLCIRLLPGVGLYYRFR